MKNRYYDEIRFKRIVKLVEENKFDNALAEYELYFEKYPNDCCARVYYSELLTRIGRFEDAERVLTDVVNNPNIRKLALEDTLLMKVKLLVSQQKYEEAYSILLNNREVFDNRNWTIKGVELFLLSKLGLLTEEHFNQDVYLLSQIVNYSEKSCLEHILKHQSYEGNDNACIFNENISLEKLYYQIREMLPLDDKVYSSVIDNVYIFKYDNCGRVDGKLVDYIKVATLQHSNDIITMYPYRNSERVVHKDLTPTIECSHIKVKRMSQIDKFNQRYFKK